MLPFPNCCWRSRQDLCHNTDMTSREKKVMRWRPWRFSLRLLLFVMFAVATFSAGWVANDWHRQRAMKVTIQRPRKLIPSTTAPMRETKVMRMHDPMMNKPVRGVPGDTFKLPRRSRDTTLINDLPK